MPRYRLDIEYDGSSFCGWQSQDHLPSFTRSSVQDVLEQALEKFCQEKVRLYVAGRTDSGVHALGQVAHVDLRQTVRINNLRDALNFHARPWPVSVQRAQKTDDSFDARRSAICRHYQYHIINRPSDSPLWKNRAWRLWPALDINAMHQAGLLLVGHHDFSAFRAAGCQASSPLRTLKSLRIYRLQDRYIIRLSAPSFLYRQVRIITGTLVKIGWGKMAANDIESILASRDRAKAGATAPPHGLYLTRVDY